MIGSCGLDNDPEARLISNRPPKSWGFGSLTWSTQTPGARLARGGAILTNVRNAKSMLRAHFEEQMAELEAIERAARGEE